MKVLFLDVDGVLNMHSSGGPMALNKKRIKELARVVETTGCKLVLSSTWRKLDDAKRKLRNHLGYKGMKIYSQTPADYFVERQVRGDEIQMWLDNHTVECYAIVDDDGDMLDHQRPFFVQTDGNQGLTAEKADALIEILGIKDERDS